MWSTPAERTTSPGASRALWLAAAGSLTSMLLLTLLGPDMSSPMALAALLGLPAAMLLTGWLLLSPTAAFLATALIIPIERLGRLTADDAMYTVSLMRIVGSLALLSLLLQAALKQRRIHLGGAFWLYLLYFGLALLGLMHSSHMLGTVRACGAVLGNLLFYLLVVNLGRRPGVADWSVGAWLVSTTMVCIFTIFSWHFGSGVSEADLGDTESRFSAVMVDTSEWEALDSIARAAGPTSHSAVYAINLILTLPFFLHYRQQAHRGWLRASLSLALLLVLYNIFLTNTRAAMLLAAGVMLLCGLRGLYRIRTAGVAAVAVGCVALLPLVPDAVWHRVLDASNYSTQRSATLRIRFEYWDAGLQVAQDHWLGGIGVGNQRVIPLYIKGDAPEETTVHNEYIMTAMELGLPGWFCFFGFVLWHLVITQRARQLAARTPGPGQPGPGFFLAAQIAMLATLVYGLQVDVFHFPLKGWWLIAGLSWALYQVQRQRPPAVPTLSSPGAPHG